MHELCLSLKSSLIESMMVQIKSMYKVFHEEMLNMIKETVDCLKASGSPAHSASLIKKRALSPRNVKGGSSKPNLSSVCAKSIAVPGKSDDDLPCGGPLAGNYYNGQITTLLLKFPKLLISEM